MNIKRGINFLKPAVFPVIFVLLSGCGKDYKKEIIGKWIAIENNCDEQGKCNSDPAVTGSTSFERDGRMTAGDKVSGSYTIKGKIIKFVLSVNEQKLPGETEIIYIKNDIMLSKTTLGSDDTTHGKKGALQKQEPFIVKYKKEKK